MASFLNARMFSKSFVVKSSFPPAGWPFAALLGLPIAVDLLVLKRQWSLFLTWSCISAVTILGPQLLCDSYYYDRPVFAALNIVWWVRR